MTKIAIIPEPTEAGGMAYRAIAGDRQSVGRTAGEALDALTDQLSEDDAGTLVIVQNLRPDRFFTDRQQERLRALMARWRAARDAGRSLPAEEQAELDSLVSAEVLATTERAAALMEDSTR